MLPPQKSMAGCKLAKHEFSFSRLHDTFKIVILLTDKF